MNAQVEENPRLHEFEVLFYKGNREMKYVCFAQSRFDAEKIAMDSSATREWTMQK